MDDGESGSGKEKGGGDTSAVGRGGVGKRLITIGACAGFGKLANAGELGGSKDGKGGVEGEGHGSDRNLRTGKAGGIGDSSSSRASDDGRIGAVIFGPDESIKSAEDVNMDGRESRDGVMD